eukprot:COSAG04_NODE_3034_length_3251_cov_224.076777_4_plen_102_part_00
MDVADEAAVGALFAEIGQCDILVNNAGTPPHTNTLIISSAGRPRAEWRCVLLGGGAGINIVEREFRRLTPANFKEVLVRKPTPNHSYKKEETADVCVQHCA